MKKILLITSLFCFSGFMNLNAQTYNTVSTFAGTSVAGLLDGSLLNAKFQGAYNMCIDPANGTMYVADTHNNSIRRIRNGMVTTLAGNGTQGDVDAQGVNARFYLPSGICFYNGYLYVTDNGNNKIKRIDTLGNSITYAGSGTAGFQDGSVVTAKFWNPTGIISDHAGGFYVADYANDCIRQISNGLVTTFAGVGGVTGDQLGAAASAQFYRPSSVCLDALGTMYVTDLGNNKVKVISGGNVSLLAGSGVQGFTNGTGASATFYHPGSVIFDTWGELLINDGGNNAIRRITTSGVVTTIAGTGLAGLVNGPAASSEFNQPAGICLGLSGEIYVGDNMNNVIRMISVGDVGMNEYSSVAQISFFPNPTTDQIIVNSDEQNIKTVSIFDMNGKLCKTISVEGEPSQITISVAELSAGEYLIVAEGEKGKSTGKLIRQ